jgi:IS5 family transposase
MNKALYERILAQKRTSKNKIYSIHEPAVSCIAKGKEHAPYEFGAKTSISILAKSCVIVDVSCFDGTPHDSKTLEPVLKTIKSRTKKEFEYGLSDRGYKGKQVVEGTKIAAVATVLPSPQKDAKQSADYQKNKSRQCKRRAAIEPVISHLKHDCRMAINYLKGTLGDIINALLAGAAFHFRKSLREIKAEISFLLDYFLQFWIELQFTRKILVSSKQRFVISSKPITN